MNIIPSTSPDGCRHRKTLGMHIAECGFQAGHFGACAGFLGELDTYVCICWCHKPHEQELRR